MIGIISLSLLIWIVIWGLLYLSTDFDWMMDHVYDPIGTFLAQFFNPFAFMAVIVFLNKIFPFVIFLWVITAIVLTIQSVF